MITVNRQGDMITGSVNGQPFSVSYDEQKFEKMLELRDKADSVETMEEMHEIIKEFNVLSAESFKELVETASKYVMVNRHTNKYYLRWGGVVSRHPFPQVLVSKILKSLEKGIDIAPLVKCWARYLRPAKGKPEYSQKGAELFAEYINALYTDDKKVTELTTKEGLDIKVATEMATTPQVAITQEGLLVCYKVSTEITKKYVKNEEQDGGVKQVDRYDYEVDEFTGLKTYKEPDFVEDRVFEPAFMGQGGDAFLCGDKLGHIIRVGHTHQLESWDQVDCNNAVTARKGLHVGGLNYIQGYQKEGTVTHNVFVDPADIGAIVGLGYGNDGAMRVRRYFVHSSFAGVNKNIYHSSKFAAMNDAEYDKFFQEIVEETKMKQKDLEAIADEANALKNIDKRTSDGSSTTTVRGALDS